MKTSDWTRSMKEEDDEEMEDVEATEELTESEEMDIPTMFDAPGLFDDAEEVIKGSDVEEVREGNQGDKGEAPPMEFVMASNKETSVSSGQTYHSGDGAPISVASDGEYGEEVPPCLAGGNHIPLTTDDLALGEDGDMARGGVKAIPSKNDDLVIDDDGDMAPGAGEGNAIPLTNDDLVIDDDGDMAPGAGEGNAIPLTNDDLGLCDDDDDMAREASGVNTIFLATKGGTFDHDASNVTTGDTASVVDSGGVVDDVNNVPTDTTEGEKTKTVAEGTGEIGLNANTEVLRMLLGAEEDGVMVDGHSATVSLESDDFSLLCMDSDDELDAGGTSQTIAPSEGFDMNLLRSCIEDGSSVLETVKDKHVVLVVGKTGVGKSLFLQGIAGKQIKLVDHVSTCYGTAISTNVFEAVDPLPGFEVGHEKMSKTRSINCLVRSRAGKKGEDILYVDTPGWEDTGGAEVDIATSVMLSQVMKLARSLRLVVLISYASLLEDRGGAVRTVLKLANTFVSDYEKDKRSFAFLFTHESGSSVTVDESRSRLAEEIARICKDSIDPEVKKILNFMYTSLKKNKGYVDVLQPARTDFTALSSFIETKLSTIRNRTQMVNCGLTNRSEMKLDGQLQQMLYSLRRLIERSKMKDNHDVIDEMKGIRGMFGYFHDHVCVGKIKKAFDECESLFKKHVDKQRLELEGQLQQARDGNANFGAGNIHCLQVALSHLDAFAVESNRGYKEKSLQEAFEVSFVRVTTGACLQNLESTLKELGKLKAWAGGFAYCTTGYHKSCDWLQTELSAICECVSVAGIHELESLDEGAFLSHAQSFVVLGAIVQAANEIASHNLDTGFCLATFEATKTLLHTAVTEWGSFEVNGSRNQSQGSDEEWEGNTSRLHEFAKRGNKLEVWHGLFCSHEGRVSCSSLLEEMLLSLENLESKTSDQFKVLCDDLTTRAKASLHGIEEQKLQTVATIDSTFNKLGSSRWRKVRQLYRETMGVLRSELMAKVAEMDNAARRCNKYGLRDGAKYGEGLQSLRSKLWFDSYSESGVSIQANCDSLDMIYHSRMEVVIAKLKIKCSELKLLSLGNATRLIECHEIFIETKQFEIFESIAGNPASVAPKKKAALEGVRKYRMELSEESKRLSSKWRLCWDGLKVDEEFKAITNDLDKILEEIETIESFTAQQQLKETAISAKHEILAAFSNAMEFTQKEFDKPREYETKAKLLACIANFNGYPRAAPHLPRFSHYKEQARKLVADDAVRVDMLLAESADGNEIDSSLQKFDAAKVLDCYTDDEATKRIRPLQSLCVQKAEERDKLLEDMIARQDFSGIGKFLNPLRHSGDIVERQKYDRHTQAIIVALKDQIQTAHEKMNVPLSRPDAQYVGDTLKTLQAAQKELRFGVVELKFQPEISGLESKLKRKFKGLVEKMVNGHKSNDFFVMGVGQHFATCIIMAEHTGEYLGSQLRQSYECENSKWKAAVGELPRKVDSFIASSFQDSQELEKSLTTLKTASEQQDPHLPELRELYDATRSSLSNRVNDSLRQLRDQVEGTHCYDDGIALLESLEKARARGLDVHLGPLPFNCKDLLDKWIKNQPKFYTLGSSTEGIASAAHELKLQMDRLRNPTLLEKVGRYAGISDGGLTYKNHLRQVEGRITQEYQTGMSCLRQRDCDMVSLRKSLDNMNDIATELAEHAPSVLARKQELEAGIANAFTETCRVAVESLRAESMIDFEACFPAMRLFIIQFSFILDAPAALREFRLAVQLVHDVLKRNVDSLDVALSQHDFLKIRSQVNFNRTHGAFLADHFSLLFEELKQLGRLESDDWFKGIWKLCCDHFSSGRDLQKIKSFARLGVVPSASEPEIRKAYKQKAIIVHPDKQTTTTSDSGEEFRLVKDALEDLLSSPRLQEAQPKLFDSWLRQIPTSLKTSVRTILRNQQYDLLERLLENLADLQMICCLVDPALSYEEVRDAINGLVKEHIHGIRVEVDSFWKERKYKELNQTIEDIKVAEMHLKSFPDVFSESWNQGIIDQVEKEIEEKGAESRLFLKDKATAMDALDDFRRCFLQMGAVLMELQMFYTFTKRVMNDVLESCLGFDWGYDYLFKIGLSFHKGDEADEDDTRIGQTLLSEFSHFKEVMTMVWNEETLQKPAEDTVRDIRGIRRSLGGTTNAPLDIDRDALLLSSCLFEAEYKRLLGEYLPSESDIGQLARSTMNLANNLKPLRCSSGWDANVKDQLPVILAGIFAMFTILKSGESYNRIRATSDTHIVGENLLMKPHSIQVLTLLHLLGCGRISGTGLESQLMQIRTGEGKSMILGAAAAILGLLGFKVRCVCYSEDLSTRDYALFESVFVHLGLRQLVTYSKITTLSEDNTALKGDIRGLTERLLHQGLVPSHPTDRQQSQRSHQNRNIRPAIHSTTHGTNLEAQEELGPNLIARPTTNLTRTPYGQGNAGAAQQSNSVAIVESAATSGVAFPPNTNSEEILLVDEVDVFFGANFYGQTYNQVTKLRRPEVASILTDIWERHTQGGRKQRLTDVQATSAYQRLVQAMPSFQFLIDNEVRLMLDHVQHIDDEPYIFDPDNDRIGYKVLDTISYQVTNGYRTVFAYLKEAANGSLKNKTGTLQRELFMPVSCGQFSYANIAPTRILGVSGTLEAMGETEKDVLSMYGIENYVFVPSVYGQSNFEFDRAGDGISIEPSLSDYFQKICENILDKTKRKRPVIVFFKDYERLYQFKNSPFYPRLGRQKAILSEDMDFRSKEFVIKKAATLGQITLCPAVFGRGTDFFTKEEKVRDAGGVHIIQTFLSTETSEEVQIQGRTARQGKKGSYEMILLENDLEVEFGLSPGEKDTIPRNERYEWLCEARRKQHGRHWQCVGENLKLATQRDGATHAYFDALLSGHQSTAASLFKDLYSMIKKPPVPEEITIDIALLLDVTGSMTPYCKHAISLIDGLLAGNNSIVSKLNPVFPETAVKLRVGVIGYRDIDDGSAQFKESGWNGEHFTETMPDALAFINNIASHPSGGHDLAEDHLGALRRCANWSGPTDWSSPIKMALLFTDAPAHGFVPTSSAGRPNVDTYDILHPEGLTAASVAGDLATRGINLMVCSYNPQATERTEARLAEEYFNHADNTSGREIKCVSMVPQSAIVTPSSGQPLLGDRPRHIVFVLDESGSMQYDWPGVVDSFRQYIARRQQNQNELDLVSVVQFDCDARVTVLREPIGCTPEDLDYSGGGTIFSAAALEGSQVAASTPDTHSPTVVFMSDGGTDESDSADAAATFAALNGQVRRKQGSDLELHVIAFGSGADTRQLQQIARASPKGRVHLSSDAVQLSEIFTGIAGGEQEVATAVQEEIAKEISEAVSDTVSLEYLS